MIEVLKIWRAVRRDWDIGCTVVVGLAIVGYVLVVLVSLGLI